MNLQEALSRIQKARESQLSTLDIANCSLTEIPAEVFELAHLTELKLGHWSDYGKQHKNNITVIPPAIAQLNKLQQLDVSSNELTELPNALAQLRQLHTLETSNNRLTNLPNIFGQLVNLQTLDLSNNQISQVPASLSHLPRLQRLNLSKNQLSTLPPDLSAWQRLQRLDVSNNLFVKFPTQIAQLPLLEQLSITANQLADLPAEINQLKTLKILYLNNNNISVLPDNWSGLQNLKRFYLNNNQISHLPSGFSALKNLQLLDIRNNLLDEVPECLQDTTQLSYLDIRKNQISNLPEWLSKLKQLELLDVRDNVITQLPPTIANLPNLQYLYLNENPLDSPPPEIANRGLTAIRNYFKELDKSNEKDYLYEIKLLLVGEGRVGKTSLSKALAILDYSLEDHQSTEGIDIKTWIVPKEELGISKDFKINIWDFGGQEIYHTTHQFFLTKRSVYLLVTESRKEDRHEDFYYWLNIIRLLGGKSPVILVLNKCDQPTKDLPIKEYRRAFANIVDFSKISCQDEYKGTISSLKRKIKQLLQNHDILPHLGTALPKVWVDIRAKLDELRQEGHEYISYEDYLKICKKYYQNEDSALFLSEFFHDLGVMLHFQDDPILKNTLFLNHEWVTQGVYSVLDNQIIKNRNGNFTDEDLQHIWQDDRYRHRQKELFALMRNEKFELCFELKPGHYLAPQLLPVDEIEYPWNNTPEQLHYEYRYQFMPKGILTRFIVKLHRHIYQSTYWRYGVVLELDNTRAIVKEMYFDRKISIVVEGENKQELLKMVRDTIQAINQSYNNVAVAEMLQCQCLACKNSSEPHFYRLDVLQRFIQRGKLHIDCEKSLDSVEVRQIISATLTTDELGQDIFRNQEIETDTQLPETVMPIQPQTAPDLEMPLPTAGQSTIEEPLFMPSGVVHKNKQNVEKSIQNVLADKEITETEKGTSKWLILVYIILTVLILLGSIAYRVFML